MGKPQSDSTLENSQIRQQHQPQSTTKNTTYFLQALHYPVTDPRRLVLRIVNFEGNATIARMGKSERALDINQVKLIVKRSTEIETKIVDHLAVIEQFSSDEEKQVRSMLRRQGLLSLILSVYTN